MYGFKSVSTFNRLFKDAYNMTPSEARKRKNRISFLSVDTILEGYKKRIPFKGDFIFFYYFFSNTELDRLHANANVKNVRSNRVREKCGFTKEGTIRHGKMVKEYCDYNVWGLLKEDLEKNTCKE